MRASETALLDALNRLGGRRDAPATTRGRASVNRTASPRKAASGTTSRVAKAAATPPPPPELEAEPEPFAAPALESPATPAPDVQPPAVAAPVLKSRFRRARRRGRATGTDSAS